MRRFHRHSSAVLAAVPTVARLCLILLVLVGCNSRPQPGYQGKLGLHITPPHGWVERARDDALPARAVQKPLDLPLPQVGLLGSSAQERLLVRYDRLKSGNLAWLRVTLADLPLSKPLDQVVASLSPGTNWKRESGIESMEVNTLPAARVAFVGQWHNQAYICETVAVRQAEQVYFITGSFPATDVMAREELRKSVAGATWSQ
jgi:hypothetical protein